MIVEFSALYFEGETPALSLKNLEKQAVDENPHNPDIFSIEYGVLFSNRQLFS